MSVEIWLIYVATVLVLMSTPGPSQLLMLSNSAAHGFHRSIATAAGDLTANAFQMLAAGLGIAAIIAVSAYTLSIIKWCGVIYLVWLGCRMIFKSTITKPSKPDNLSSVSLKSLWLQGFITSAANPKAVVFFAALFPQFIQAEYPFWPQFLLLSVTYLVIDGIFLSAYGYGAGWIAMKIKGSAQEWIERVGGTLMIVAAVLLGFKSLERQ